MLEKDGASLFLKQMFLIPKSQYSHLAPRAVLNLGTGTSPSRNALGQGQHTGAGKGLRVLATHA